MRGSRRGAQRKFQNPAEIHPKEERLIFLSAAMEVKIIRFVDLTRMLIHETHSRLEPTHVSVPATVPPLSHADMESSRNPNQNQNQNPGLRSPSIYGLKQQNLPTLMFQWD